MSSASQGPLVALCDAISSISISAARENQQAESPSSTALLTSLNSLPPSTDDMDPFRQDIILRLRDLLTLHHLYQASPAIADYLNHTSGFFPKVIESLMLLKEYGNDMSPNTDTKIFFRTLVYLWWREQSVATGELIPSADNPLPATFGLYDRLAPGCLWAQKCEVVPQSGIREAGLQGKFRKYGVAFWENNTMIGLGLLLQRSVSETACRDVAYRWTSLLQPEDEVRKNKKAAPKEWTHSRRSTTSNSRY
ncbi:hypothetical protein N7463_006219 [Penicillium fimorum]|uniref:Uncharacterized protein n=1 Tax=Penicillium fimorum TaxID=1882269 RepID=A0A9X0C6E6_9EURO|nr:hypothetical protein N7463_006219 [Penicillium fimorum]